MNADRQQIEPKDQRSSDELDRAFEELERETPDTVTRFILWLRKPQARKFRLPLGILCIVGACLWFLPIVGIELLPVGLLLIAQDVPFLRRPVARGTLYLLHLWRQLRRWWQGRRARKQ
jgi:hypothetical protein